MTELQIIRMQIPNVYDRTKEAFISYKKYQNRSKQDEKEKLLSELFRLIEEELKLSTKTISRNQK